MSQCALNRQQKDDSQNQQKRNDKAVHRENKMAIKCFFSTFSWCAGRFGFLGWFCVVGWTGPNIYKYFIKA